MAHVYMKKGNKEMAQKNYEKSIEVQPELKDIIDDELKQYLE